MNDIETRLTVVTAATEEVVSLDQAKQHLRVDDETDDALIEGLIAAAREYCETATRRQFVSTTYALRMDNLPTEIVLPKPPLVSVSSITYVDSAGATQTLSSSLYTVNQHREPGVIVPAYQATWPTVRGHTNDVVIQFVAGYGAASAVPKAAKQAILLLIGTWYENREASGIEIGGAPYTVPMTVDALLSTLNWGSYV